MVKETLMCVCVCACARFRFEYVTLRFGLVIWAQ